MTSSAQTNKYDVCIVGGGPAGLMSAISAVGLGKRVLLIDKNKYCGKKLNITGKGRCNITNNSSIEEFMQNIPVNPKFMYRALTVFSPSDTIDFFNTRGVAVKTEQGRRVFPESDDAKQVTDCLVNECKNGGVRIIRGTVTEVITHDKKVTAVMADTSAGPQAFECASVIIATGGLSYPGTGSTGDGYRLAKSLGHTIVEPTPSLVPLLARGDFCTRCAGLSLKNVTATFTDKQGKVLYKELGEMLFTHFGVSGPIVLSGSAHIKKDFPVSMTIDLKPGLDTEKLDKRILKDFSQNQNKDFQNSLSALLPAKIIQPIIDLSGIPATKKVHEITRQERKGLVDLLKSLPLSITGTAPIATAIVTSGGIKTTEINPSTLESKLIDGLYFAGEVIDVDGYTGGYNLQIAFSTGYLAGQNA